MEETELRLVRELAQRVATTTLGLEEIAAQTGFPSAGCLSRFIN